MSEQLEEKLNRMFWFWLNHVDGGIVWMQFLSITKTERYSIEGIYSFDDGCSAVMVFRSERGVYGEDPVEMVPQFAG